MSKKTQTTQTVSDAEYLSRASLSGNVLIKKAVESRMYSNERENGTTAVILAVLASGGLEKSVTIEDFATRYAAVKDGSFKCDAWKVLEKQYAKIPSNRSADPAKKIGPVVTGLIREGKAGMLKGFDVALIGTQDLRAAFGYKF
jgi:hypothetical protein